MSDRRNRLEPPGAADAATRGEEEPVELEVTDVLDLHSFAPGEVKALVRDYLDLAAERGLSSLRIVHGRGTGVQRRIVRSILGRHPRVRAFGDAPAEAGGWGATAVELTPGELTSGELASGELASGELASGEREGEGPPPADPRGGPSGSDGER